MKAMACEAFGKPDVLRMMDVPEPQVLPRDILIEVDHAAINPVDAKIRSGVYAQGHFPLVLGFDVSGVVKACGEKVTKFKVGDEVYGCGSLIRQGGNAPRMAMDERLAAHKPSSLTHQQAAGLPLVTITAWEALHKRCRLHKGQTVLIHAGGGGVGHIAVQLAKNQGARVITTASSEASLALCEKAGADVIINYKKEDVVARVMKETQDKGCEVVFDTIGDATFNTSLACVGLNGQVVTILAPDTSHVRKLFRKNASLHFEYMPAAAIHEVDMDSHGSLLATAAELVDAGRLFVHIGHVIQLEDLAAGHRQQESAATTGKIVVQVKR